MANDEPTCANCRFWRVSETGPEWCGICRRHPPTVLANADGDIHSFAWPETGRDEWCGDHAPERLDADGREGEVEP